MMYILPVSPSQCYWKDPSNADDDILELQCPPSSRYETIQELDPCHAFSQAENGNSRGMDVDLVSNSVSCYYLF